MWNNAGAMYFWHDSLFAHTHAHTLRYIFESSEDICDVFSLLKVISSPTFPSCCNPPMRAQQREVKLQDRCCVDVLELMWAGRSINRLWLSYCGARTCHQSVLVCDRLNWLHRWVAACGRGQPMSKMLNLCQNVKSCTCYLNTKLVNIKVMTFGYSKTLSLAQHHGVTSNPAVTEDDAKKKQKKKSTAQLQVWDGRGSESEKWNKRVLKHISAFQPSGCSAKKPFFFFLAFVRQCQLKCPQPWAQRQQWQPIHFPDELSPAGREVTSPKVIYGIVDLSFLHLQLFATHKHTPCLPHHSSLHPQLHPPSISEHFISMLYCFYPPDCFDLYTYWWMQCIYQVSENGQSQTWQPSQVWSLMLLELFGPSEKSETFLWGANQAGVFFSSVAVFKKKNTAKFLCNSGLRFWRLETSV